MQPYRQGFSKEERGDCTLRGIAMFMASSCNIADWFSKEERGKWAPRGIAMFMA